MIKIPPSLIVIRLNVSLLEKYAKDYKLNLIEVKLTTGKKLNLSPGKHNQLQIHVLEKFVQIVMMLI